MSDYDDNQLIDDARYKMLRESLTPSTKIFMIEKMRENVIDVIDTIDFDSFMLLTEQFRTVCELLGLKSDSIEVGRPVFEQRKASETL